MWFRDVSDGGSMIYIPSGTHHNGPPMPPFATHDEALRHAYMRIGSNNFRNIHAMPSFLACAIQGDKPPDREKVRLVVNEIPLGNDPEASDPGYSLG
jgi:hypothetical protein